MLDLAALEEVTGDVSRGLLFLLAAVGSLLLIARINVANLLLGRVLAFAVLISLTTRLLFGLAPAWHAWNVDLIGSLRENARTASHSFASRRLCDVLTVGEIAVAMILLTGAGLFIHSFSKLNQSDSGFDPRNVLTFDVSWPYEKHPNPIQAFQQLRTRLLEIPGVVAASIGLQLPDRGHATLDDTSPFVAVEGRPMGPNERRRTAVLENVDVRRLVRSGPAARLRNSSQLRT